MSMSNQQLHHGTPPQLCSVFDTCPDFNFYLYSLVTAMGLLPALSHNVGHHQPAAAPTTAGTESCFAERNHVLMIFSTMRTLLRQGFKKKKKKN